MRKAPVSIFAGIVLLTGSAAFAAPANDDRANATVIAALPFSDSVDTTGATTEADEPQPYCAETFATVWYRFTPAENGRLIARASGFDTVLAVYSATGLDQLACNDDVDGPFDRSSKVTLNAVAGEDLLFQVGGYDGAEGPLTFSLESTTGGGGGGGAAPANDDRANATVMAELPFVEAIDLADATVEPDEFEPDCEWSPTSSVWYTYTPAESRSVLIDLSPEDEESFSFFVAVYRDGGDFVAQIACFGGYFGATVYLESGDTYLLQVGANADFSENLRATLSLSLPPEVDFAVTKLEVRNAPLRTDWADVPSGFARKVDVEIKLLSSSVPGPAPYYLDVLACPKTALDCEYIEFTYDELEPGGTFTGTFDWNGLGDAGDFRIHAFVDPENAEDIDGRNNSKSVDHYVLVGGTGVGVHVSVCTFPIYYVICL